MPCTLLTPTVEVPRTKWSSSSTPTVKATGTAKTHTNWIQVVVFGNLTNSLLHLTKGDKVTVTGRLHTDSRTRPWLAKPLSTGNSSWAGVPGCSFPGPRDSPCSSWCG
ncbi:MAG TPA: single-stranded DNA-binding protein [Thermoanaerobaculia bacterium]|nr:single-stranded DNA-binding protein [Thermoanaerobaculia bacterium]